MAEAREERLKRKLAYAEQELASAILQRRILNKSVPFIAALSPLLWLVDFWLIFGGLGLAVSVWIAAEYIGRFNVHSAEQRLAKVRAEVEEAGVAPGVESHA